MMTVVFWLLLIQGVIGAFDTFWFHEWRARLPAGGAQTAPELKLHAWRSFLYAVIFAGLPLLEWHGWWVLVLAAVLTNTTCSSVSSWTVTLASCFLGWMRPGAEPHPRSVNQHARGRGTALSAREQCRSGILPSG